MITDTINILNHQSDNIAIMKIISPDGIQALSDGAKTIMTWDISIIAGSLIALLSTSYVRPVKGLSKLMYLLFIPGWIFLGFSLKYGDEINRSIIMLLMSPKSGLSNLYEINTAYGYLLNCFRYALCFFGGWLFWYLLWFIFSDFTKK